MEPVLKNTSRYAVSLALALLAAPMAVSAQARLSAPNYALGNQALIISAGLFTPLFFQSPEGSFSGTNLSLGGVGSLQWAAYLNNNMTIGLEGGGMFAFSPNSRALFMLPITARYMYIFRFYPFEVPLSISAGINFTRLADHFQILPIMKPGASFFWNYDYEWAFGLNLIWWWSPNVYFGPTPSSSQTRFGNFLEITLSAMYHF
jgi:hypothetical protein